MTNERMLLYRKTVEGVIRKEWRGTDHSFGWHEFKLRLSKEDIRYPTNTDQNIKKMAKRIAMFEELVYGE